ncbi:MAG: quinol:cytochrome C oxidoreductase, partial [Flavobacteriaceae bacterium]|nr:quinol:cytochrome C oxidoreductase [Flavobacteriaceae bacterium]
MKKIKKYWKSSEELKKDSKILNEFKNKEFVQKLPEDIFDTNKQALEDSSTNRRDFLKYVGFSTAAVGIAACEGPVINSVPYVVQPDEIIPGNANYYASSIADGYDYRNILVKTREGRPIKIKQNKDAISLGECNARVLASVLSLYDSKRLKGPKV